MVASQVVGFGLRKARIFEISRPFAFKLSEAHKSIAIVAVNLYYVMLYDENQPYFDDPVRGAFGRLLRL